MEREPLGDVINVGFPLWKPAKIYQEKTVEECTLPSESKAEDSGFRNQLSLGSCGVLVKNQVFPKASSLSISWGYLFEM